MIRKAYEVNFDGLVGPTHNYAGLSYGNLASQRHGLTVSHPRQAALQGLAKMKFMADLGLKQGVLPPHQRPDLATLRRLGFGGTDADVLWKAHREAPRLLAACYSASSMWTANAATVSPGADSADGRVHFTPANLLTQFHRSIETAGTARALRAIFADPERFVHHDPLPAGTAFADEGAANHMRLCEDHDRPGVQIFVYGRVAFGAPDGQSLRFPARQTAEASAAIARLHELDPARTLLVPQSPSAIDAGVFHNDVVAVGNENVLFHHESAFADADAFEQKLRDAWSACCTQPLHLVRVREQELPLTEAVDTYLFNSQLVTLPDGEMALIAPAECRESDRARGVIAGLLAAGTPVRTVHYVDVRQSMRNGGGPACLRLRVVLTEEELAQVPPGALLTDRLYAELTDWARRRYRDDLAPDDLADPALLDESRAAFDELAGILGTSAAG